jgi:hypothetical protein
MSDDEDYYTSFNAFAEYAKTIREDHSFKIMGGYNQEYKHNKYFYAGRKGLIDNDNPALNLAVGDRLMNANESHWSVNGFFMRLNYDYKHKYLLEVNGRYDGSSKFLKTTVTHSSPPCRPPGEYPKRDSGNRSNRDGTTSRSEPLTDRWVTRPSDPISPTCLPTPSTQPWAIS